MIDLSASFASFRRFAAPIYSLLLLTAVVAWQLGMPIMLTDTDMWYHLAAGREFWAQGAVPDRPFYAFWGTDRAVVDYFWGFQAVIYKIHQQFGYQGLLLLRALLTLGCLLLVFAYLRRALAGRPALPLMILCALVVMVIIVRTGSLRPHLVSMLMIAASLYILDWRPQWLPALPVLTLVWVNLHGIEYIIALFVGACYGIDHLWSLRAGMPAAAKSRTALLWLLACLPVLLLTPHGYKLFPLPFSTPPDLGFWVLEMQPISWPGISAITQFNPLSRTFLLLLFVILAIAALAYLGWQRKLRIAHGLLVLGGLYLIFTANRFIAEFMLLSLPAIAALWRQAFGDPGATFTRGPALVLLAAFVLALPFLHLQARADQYRDRQHPFSGRNLPVATSRFLATADAQGNLVVSPTLSGYIEWASYPAIRVFMDMQLPPYTGLDYLEYQRLIQGPELPSRLSDGTQLDFFLSQCSVQAAEDEIHYTCSGAAEKLIEAGYEGDYAPVFLDPPFILFANRNSQSALVERYLISALQPEDILAGEASLDEKLAEVDAMIAASHPSFELLRLASLLLMSEERYTEALAYTEKLVALYPWRSESQILMGNNLGYLEDYRKALVFYQRALDLVSDSAELEVQIGGCYYALKDFPAAYRLFRRSLNPYQNKEPRNLLAFAVSSAVVGDVDRARRLLEILSLVAEEEKHGEQIEEARTFGDKLDASGYRQSLIKPFLVRLGWL